MNSDLPRVTGMAYTPNASMIDPPGFFEQQRPHNGLTYEEYISQWKTKLEQPLKGLDRVARRYHFYSKYNDERSGRVKEAYVMNTDFRATLEAINEPQLWMIITEDWCVDSAYTLPIFYAAAVSNSQIKIRILPRDSNLDIMDQYLTNEARSIPKLVIFTMEGQELGVWGPRPATLQAMRKEMKDAGESGNIISQKSVEWYEAGGWREVEKELNILLRNLGK